MPIDEMCRWKDYADARLKVQSEAVAAQLATVIARMFGAK